MLHADGTERDRRSSRPRSARQGSTAEAAEAVYGVRGILASRSRFHVVYRLMVRLNQVGDPAGGARTTRWRWLLAASAGADVILWQWLRRSDRLALWPRLPLDALDTAVWSFAPYPDGYWDYAVLPGVPLGVEAGLGHRWRGMVVPVVNAAATSLARRSGSRPVQVAPFLWQVLAVIGGAGFNRYNRRVRADIERIADERLAADEARAMLAGQNAVAMGADTVIDKIQSIAPLFGRPAPGSALHELVDGWKAALAEATQHRAAYLGTVIAAWQRSHNTHPDLWRRVDLDLAPGHGTVLLTARQADVLPRALTAMNLRGQLPVRVRDAEGIRAAPGRRIDLMIGERPVSVPPDDDVPPRSPDFGPVGLAMAACMYARLATPTAERVPTRVVVPLMATTIAAAAVAEHQLRRRGSAAQDNVQAMALAIAGTATALATRTARRPFKPSGGQNFPFYSTLTIPMLLYAFQHRDLSGRFRWVIPTGLAAIICGGWVLAPRPRQFGQFVLSLSWPLSGAVAGLKVSGEFGADARRLADSLRARERAAIDAAYDRGTASVIGLARAAYADATAQLQDHRERLAAELVEVAERRLQEVHRCLDQLTVIAADESPSSTTTRSA
jgi:hypothetical protein